MNLESLTIKEARKGLEEKEFSSVELTKACLDSIKEKNGANNAYISVLREEAIRQAQEADIRIGRGEKAGEMEGIPVAVKDNILVSGAKATAGSRMLENYDAPFDATAVKKLKESGAVILGKTNMDEFAMGSSTETSFFGPTRNPHDLERVAGGSSGGSAAAVAADMCLAAIGSDTGGSIRQPASFCGTVGMKPTYGRVSRYGLMAMASSLDQIGPLSKTAEDAEIIYGVIAGKDPLDSTTVARDHGNGKEGREKPLKKIRIGVLEDFYCTDQCHKPTDEKSQKVVVEAIEKISDMGVECEAVSLPHLDYSLAVYYILMPAEVSSNLARYDGIKYGYSASDKSVVSLLEGYFRTRRDGLGDEARRRIMLGTYVLSSGYYDTYYLKAQKVRTLIRKDFEKAFEKFDVIISPTSPCPAFRAGEKFSQDPLMMYLSDIYTVPANIAGIPAISVPCGFVETEAGGKSLPVGMQIMGSWFDEDCVFKVAKAWEKISGGK